LLLLGHIHAGFYFWKLAVTRTPDTIRPTPRGGVLTLTDPRSAGKKGSYDREGLLTFVRDGWSVTPSDSSFYASATAASLDESTSGPARLVQLLQRRYFCGRMNWFCCKLAQVILGAVKRTKFFGVKGQGHRRPKLDWKAWRRHHSWSS